MGKAPLKLGLNGAPDLKIFVELGVTRVHPPKTPHLPTEGGMGRPRGLGADTVIESARVESQLVADGLEGAISTCIRARQEGCLVGSNSKGATAIRNR